jgi:hypothetical protein
LHIPKKVELRLSGMQKRKRKNPDINGEKTLDTKSQ